MRSLTRYAEEAKKIPSFIYKLGAQAYIRKAYPRHLFIETTATCQLSCNYCPREKVRKDMDYSMFKDVVIEASSFGPTSFSLHLFGEPLLWPHCIEGIRYIKQLNREHVVLLTTNGVLLDRYVAGLLDAGTDEIIWSWRPEATFKASTKRWLLNSTKYNRTRFRVRFIKEVTPKEAWKEWGTWPSVEVRSLHNYGGNINTATWAPTDGTAPKASSTKKERRWPCYHLWFAPAIAWNGKILLCCADPHQKEILGQFPEVSMAQAWKRISKIRESHMRSEFKGICENCDTWRNYPNVFFKWQQRS